MALAVSLALPAMASAQDSRTAAIAAEQSEKATRLAPRVPSKAEQTIMMLQRSVIEAPSGFYPFFGSVYSGGGFTLGGGYRQFFGDQTWWNIAGLYSAKGYKPIELASTSRGHFADRLLLRARLGWRDATQVAYHGLGIDSPADPGAQFRLQQAYGGGDLVYKPVRWAVFRASGTYESFTLKEPTSDLAFVDDAYNEATAPGVGVDPDYFHTYVSAGYDSRPAVDYARRGGLYEVSHHHYGDRDDTYSFNRVDTEVVQHIPILRENWVISLHGLLQSTVGDTDRVPYFLLPSLGSGSTLRAFSSWRFRDRNAVLASGEFRWIPSRLVLDLALFYDTGMVAAKVDQFTTNRLVHDAGIGVRFHGPLSTPLRVELARGREGLHLVFAGSAAF
jgi:outer membrane protein assembly factor BamA